MTEKTSSIPAAASPDLGDFEIVFGSGGTVALLAAAGAYSACQLAGLKLRRIGGASGGAVLACMAASGLGAPQTLRLTIQTSFNDHVNYRHGIYKSVQNGIEQVKAIVVDTNEKPAQDSAHPDYPEWPVTGLLGTTGLGRYIKEQADKAGVQSWPESFWTIATTKSGEQVIFNKDGVFLVCFNGQLVQLSKKTVPLEIAVRYSATIPGIMAALEYKGTLLYDGSLSRDGLCPVGPLIRNFGADPEKIIACRVLEDAHNSMPGRLHRLLRAAWWVEPDYNWGPETAGVIELRPHIDHVYSLRFGISEDEKWLAVLVSFETALAKFALQEILSGEARYRARSIFKALGYWRDSFPAPVGAPQLLARRAEAVFADHQLY